MPAGKLKAEDIVLVADPWCPFNCVPGSDYEGYMVDIARSILEANGHQLTYGTVNWSRAIRGAQDGVWAGVIGAAANEVPGFVLPRIPLGLVRNVLFSRVDDPWTFKGEASLDGKVVATIKGYQYGPNVDGLWRYARADAQTGKDALRLNFLKLWAGRVDVVLADESAATYLLKEMAQEGSTEPVRIFRPPWPPQPLYVAFSPVLSNAQMLTDQLDRGMVRLRANGQLQEIRARYGVIDWERATASR
jgi:polar amino acid transport system substrate-binding protein